MRSSRRQVLARSAGLLAAPWFIPASAIGRDGVTPLSERITLGFIGLGSPQIGMGMTNLKQFIKLEDCRVIAVCDVDDEHLRPGVEAVDERYGDGACTGYRDFRELIARDDIDAVCISTPDHWHGIIALAALRAGKDVYGEKPIAHTFAEGRRIADAAEKHARIWQTGSWQRSQFNFRQACEAVLNGRIGRVTRVEVGLPGGHRDVPPDEREKLMQLSDAPSHLDYEFWIGPGPVKPYCAGRVHKNWRWDLDYGGGQIMDWIGHHNDIAHWGLGLDGSGPVEVEAHGTFPPGEAIWHSPTAFNIKCRYAQGMEILINDAPPVARGGSARDGHFQGTKWIGDRGWVHVDRGRLEASDPAILKDKPGQNDTRLEVSNDHWRQFLDCVKMRRPTLTPARVAHRSVTPGHLGYVSMALGRKLRWDPDAEAVIGDPAAEQMLKCVSMRAPWKL